MSQPQLGVLCPVDWSYSEQALESVRARNKLNSMGKTLHRFLTC